MFDLSSLTAALRRTVKTFEDRLIEIRSELGKLRAQRDAVVYAPAARSDVKAMLTAWVQNTGAAYSSSLQRSLHEFIRTPRSLQVPKRIEQLVCLVAPDEAGASPDLRNFDQALCALFGDQLTRALVATIDAMEWPEEGLPLADRASRVEKLDEKITALQAEEVALINQAQSAGIILQ